MIGVIMQLDYRPPLVAVLVGLGARLLGMGTADALLVGLVVLVLGVVLITLDLGATHEWPEADLEAHDGTRREIAALTWSFIGRDGRVSEAAVRRLRVVAAHRLGRCGVTVPGGTRPFAADPEHLTDAQSVRARELLGERAWRTLTGRGGWMPSLSDVAHCVDVLERLPTTERPHA